MGLLPRLPCQSFLSLVYRKATDFMCVFCNLSLHWKDSQAVEIIFWGLESLMNRIISSENENVSSFFIFVFCVLSYCSS